MVVFIVGPYLRLVRVFPIVFLKSNSPRQTAFFLGVTLIIVLLGGSSPPAITWLVVAVVVDSVNAQSLGLFSHIGEEIFKT